MTSRPRWVPDDLFPFQSRFVEVGGNVVHYVDEGRGPTLLLLHGNPTWSFLYRNVILALRGRFRCVAPDLPGFGLSTAAPGYDFRPESHALTLESLVARLDLRSFTPFVQDWGGPIGLAVAARHADLVRALIIGNTWGWSVSADPHFRRFSRLMGGPVGKLAIRRFNAFVNVLIPLGTRRRKLTRHEMTAYRRALPTPARRTPSHVFPREIIESSAFLGEVESGLSTLRSKPVQILWGDQDIAFRAQERARWERIFPDARTHVLAGAGHYIQEDAPEEIAEVIVRFFDERVGSGP